MSVEIDFYIPLTYNSNEAIPNEVLGELKQEIVTKFGGITDFKFKGEGEWKMAGVTFRDEVVVWRAYGEDSPDVLKFLSQLKGQMKLKLRQADVLIAIKQTRFV